MSKSHPIPLAGLPLGTIEETPERGEKARGERFEIADENGACWYVGKLRRIDQEREAIKAATAERIAQLDADEKRLRFLYDAQLEAWARGVAEKRRRRTVTLPLAGASLTLRLVPAAVQLGTDPDERLAATDVAQTLGLVKTAPDFAAYRKHAKEHFETTGELLPGTVRTEEREVFGIKYGSSSPSEDAPLEE